MIIDDSFVIGSSSETISYSNFSIKLILNIRQWDREKRWLYLNPEKRRRKRETVIVFEPRKKTEKERNGGCIWSRKRTQTERNSDCI